jgi:hypothetical protein
VCLDAAGMIRGCVADLPCVITNYGPTLYDEPFFSCGMEGMLLKRLLGKVGQVVLFVQYPRAIVLVPIVAVKNKEMSVE